MDNDDQYVPPGTNLTSYKFSGADIINEYSNKLPRQLRGIYNYEEIYDALNELSKTNESKNKSMAGFRRHARFLIVQINRLIDVINELIGRLQVVITDPKIPKATQDSINKLIQEENDKILKLIKNEKVTGVNIDGLKYITNGLSNIKDRLVNIFKQHGIEDSIPKSVNDLNLQETNNPITTGFNFDPEYRDNGTSENYFNTTGTNNYFAPVSRGGRRRTTRKRSSRRKTMGGAKHKKRRSTRRRR